MRRVVQNAVHGQQQMSAGRVVQAIEQLVAEFIGFRPELAYRFDPTATLRDMHGFPSYRSWEMACDLLAERIRQAIDPAEDRILASVIKGAIGVGAGTEFVAYLRVQAELAVLDDILSGRDYVLPPHARVDARWALVGALAARCRPEYHGAVWGVVQRLEKEGSPDLAIQLVRLCHHADATFTRSKEFELYSVAHLELVR